jgi:crotonobetainyl-CoA:carnitine CoA-transferase CaiB-like acyl-CoA transferase
VPLSVQVADIGGGGLQAAVAILGALVAVQRGGEGRWLDVSMTDAAMSWMSLTLAARGGGEAVARGDQRLTGRHACYRVYACKGGGFYSVGALEPKFWAALCIAIGRQDLVGLQFAEGAEGDDVHRAMEEVFASKTRSEWERELAELDACCEPVLELDEVASHPQVAARGLIAKRKTGVEVRPAVQMRSDWRRKDPPGLGQDTVDVLTELRVDEKQLDQLKVRGVI